MTSDVDSAKSEKLERQILELWDRVYQNWMSSNDTNGPKVSEDAVRTSWEEFITDIQKSPGMYSSFCLLISYIASVNFIQSHVWLRHTDTISKVQLTEFRRITRFINSNACLVSSGLRLNSAWTPRECSVRSEKKKTRSWIGNQRYTYLFNNKWKQNIKNIEKSKNEERTITIS